MPRTTRLPRSIGSKPEARSPLLSWQEILLASLLTAGIGWQVMSTVQSRHRMDEYTASIRGMIDLENVIWSFPLALSTSEPDETGRTGERSWQDAIRRFHEGLAAVDWLEDRDLRIDRHIEELKRSVSRLSDMYEELLRARELGDGQGLEAAFLDEVYRAHNGIRAVQRLRSAAYRAEEAEHDTGWMVLLVLVLFSGLLGILSALIFRWNHRRLRVLHRTKEALHESRELLETVISNASIVLWAIDARGVFTLCEGDGLKALGLEPGEVLGRSAFEVYADAPDVLEMLHETLAGEPTSRIVEVGELSYQSTTTPLRGEANEVIGAIGVATDVTEQKHAERKLRASELGHQQRRKAEAIGRLAGGITHEFSNQLTVIAGFTHLVKASIQGNPAALRDLEQVERAASRSAELTHQLLVFSRRQRSEPRVLDLNLLVREATQMLSTLLGEDVELSVTHHEEPAWLRVDSGQFELLLVNLTVNARDAMPDGGRLEIDTAIGSLREGEVDGLSAGEYVTLSVRDDGVGMTKDVLEQALEPFFTTKEPGRGTGLGLSTCSGIVRQQGGNLTIESSPGAGTTVRVFLPAVEEPRAAAPALLAEVPPPRGGDETVLLVEDETMVRTFAARVLHAQGYAVIEAENGERALEASEAHDGPIDVLITDLVMPRMGGRELARRIVRQRPDLPVLYVSGYSEEERSDPASRASETLLGKPFGPDELARAVRRLLDGPRPLASRAREPVGHGGA